MSVSKNSKNLALDTARHSLAHLLAAAVQQMFPEAQFGVGPVVDNGCYYDFILPRTLIPEDLPLIEKKIRGLLNRNLAYKVQELSLGEALDLFASKGQPLKVELLNDLAMKGTTSMDESEAEIVSSEGGALKITVYRIIDETTGETLFEDLCKGPHVEHVKELMNLGFVLDKFSSSYWRGDQARDIRMQRIYALIFETQAELDKFVTDREEARKRDHRILGEQLNLFTSSELVGPGLPLWTPKGTVLRNMLHEFVWNMRKAKGYQMVAIPHITKKELYMASGHWAKFSDELFRIKTRDGYEFAMKPMNCPHHTQIYKSRQRSYKDLPQRYAETTMVYRDEQSGELGGLSRVRSITQDDAHVFCRRSQIEEEMLKIWEIIEKFYGEFGFELSLRFSTHDPAHMEAYKGEESLWKSAEDQILKIIQKKVGDEYMDGVGEAAFYGPKIDFMAKDSLGRSWQVATIQLDFNQPEGFDLTCIDENGEKERIVMIHAAIMGSIERFLSVLIEHTGARFPLWLAPVQVKILTVNDQVLDYVHKVKEVLNGVVLMHPVKYNELRYELDDRGESLGKKIREAEMEKVPMMLIVGPKDAEAGLVSVRTQAGEEKVELNKLGEYIMGAR